MALRLDHVVVAVNNLETAIRDYQELGFTVIQGGVHANRATKNALIAFLDGTYIELLARTDETPISAAIDFSPMLEKGEGFVGFALRSDDLDADVARLQALGFLVGNIVPGERKRPDGKLIQWKLALLDNGFAPFLIQDVTPHEWRVSTDRAIVTHANQALGLDGVVIAVRDMKRSFERYKKLIDANADSRSDTSNRVGFIRLQAPDNKPPSEDEVLLNYNIKGLE